MAEEVTSIGIGVETDGLERGRKSLEALAQQGPKVEKALKGVESAASGANKAAEGIGTGNSAGLKSIGSAADDAAKKLGWYRDAQGRMRDESGKFVSVARQTEAGLKGIGEQSGNAADKMKGLESAIASASDSFNMIKSGIQGLIGLQIVGWATDAGKALFEASREAERLRIGLDFASARGSADEIAYLRKTTDDLGLSFSSTAKAYMQFQAAAKGTSIEGDKARAVFEAVSKAAAVMGLSADQSSGALLALQQMVSKGTVQAEELRGQLGERLPGAFQIAARAMGVTTAELGKMLEMGQVMSDDFLPKFARQLDQELGGAAEKAADRLDASVNRFNNAWEKLKQTTGDSGVSKAISSEMDAIARDIQSVEETIARAVAEGSSGFSALAQGAFVAAGRTGFSTLNLAANTLNGTINLLTGDLFGLRTDLAILPDSLKTNAQQMTALATETAGAEKYLAELQKRAATEGSSAWLLKEIGAVNRYIVDLRAAKSEKESLIGGSLYPVSTDGMGNSQAILAQRKSLEDQTKAALEATKGFQSLGERMDAVSKSGDKAREALKALEGAGQGTSKQAEQLRDRIKGVDEQLAKMAKSGTSGAGALKQQENSYATLAQKAADYVKTLQLESQQGSKLTQSQKLQLELSNLLATSKGKVSAATVSGIQASLAIAKAMEGETVAIKRAQEAYQDYLSGQSELADYDVARSKALESARLAMDASETTARNAMRRIELEAGLIGASNEQRAVMLAQLEEEIRLEKELAAIDALDTDEANREELRKRARAVSAKNIAVAEGKAYVAEWDKTSQLIGDTLSDYIMGGGKDAAEYLKRLFSTLVLQPAVQTLVSGVMGTGTAAVAGGGAGILNQLGNSGGGFTKWSNLGGNAGDWLLNQSTKLGLNGMEGLGDAAFKLGDTIKGVDAWLKDVPGMSGGIGSALGYAGAVYSLTQGNYGSAIGQAVGTWILPGIGTMLGGMVGSLLDGFDNSGTLHYGAGAVYSGGRLQEGADIYNRNTFGMGSRGEWNASAQQNASGIAGSLGAALDVFAVSFGQKAGYEISTAFADDSSKDGAWGSLRIADAVGNVLVDWENSRSSKWAPREFGDGEEGYQEYLDAVAVDVKSAFLQMDIPGWGRQLLEAATDLESLSAALTQIGAIKTAFEAMGRSMQSFANLTGDMQTQLINASGGMEALSGNAASFYESFYSESERMQTLREQVNASLDSLGVSLGNPLDAFDGESAKEAFRRNFEEAMATGQGELAAAMLALNQDFATAANYAEKLGDAVDGTAGSMRAAIDALSDAAQSALSARSTASSLLSQIGSATGNGYASQREGQLWSAMGSANGYQQQIDLASELTDLVLGRYEAEKQLLEQNSAIARQTGEQQIAFARQLGDYVQSLMTGSLSPLTNAEKLAQAQQNYQGTLAAAQGGDTAAQGNLQNVSSEYLQLARMYFASSDDYTKIFDAVTSQLGNLSAVTMSEGQMQISIAEQSLSVSSSTLGQLGTLQSILESAYAEADADYIVQTDLLQEQLEAMLGVKGGIEQVAQAISSMPTELAVLFSSLNRVDGSHANGLGYVPFDGYRAELHKGERVLTAAENSAYRPDFSSYGRGGDAALVAEVKALRAEVAALRSENREDAAMQARATVHASQLNAQEVVQGVGGATERAAYQSNMGVTMR